MMEKWRCYEATKNAGELEIRCIYIYIYTYIVLIIRNPYLGTHEFAQKWRMHHSNLTV